MQLDNIDKVVLPISILMLFVLLHLKPIYLIINSVFSSILYLLLISYVFVTPVDFIINISAVLCIIIIGGLLFMRVSRISQRKQFSQSFQINILHNNLRDEMDERIAIQEKLEYTLKELSSSINYAKNLQMTFMPSESLIENISKDFFVLFKPRDQVSGDFYWINHSEDETIIAVADCTGHGIPGAFMSILGITLLNKIVKDFRLRKTTYNASDILDNLRIDIISAAKRTHNNFNYKDGLDISLCIIDKSKRQLQFSGAYSNLWHIREENKTPILTTYKGNTMPIGPQNHCFNPFTNHTIELQNNDSIVLSTDGFQDQFGGTEYKRFQSKQLKALLLANHALPMADQKIILKTVFNDWKGEHEQIDDVLTMGIRFRFKE
jgi:serine phosphatase RsbU (regulator of sigma subunit)